MHRHSLSPVFSLSTHDSYCRFRRVDARAHRLCINGPHRVRTTASRLWPCTSPQRWLCFKSAVRGLSYPEPPDFSGWRTFQASPQVPAASLRPHQPSSAEPVLLLPYSPGANPARVSVPSAHCNVASPIKGTTLRQRLDPCGGVDPVGLATDVPLWGVCIRQLGGLPAAVSSAAETAGGNPPSMRVLRYV
jgi:hypothetical protein